MTILKKDQKGFVPVKVIFERFAIKIEEMVGTLEKL